MRSFQSVQNRRQTNARQESSMYTNTIEMVPEDDEEEKKEENSSQNFEVDSFRRSRIRDLIKFSKSIASIKSLVIS